MSEKLKALWKSICKSICTPEPGHDNNADQKATAAAIFVIVAGLILLSGLMHYYLKLHNKGPEPSQCGSDIFYATGRVDGILTNPVVNGEADTSSFKVNVYNLTDAVMSLPDDCSSPLVFEFKDRIRRLKGFVLNPPEGDENGLINSNSLWVAEIKKEVDEIEKKAMNLSENDGYFWSTGRKKWLEIIFWGEFGVIVGILAWISTQLALKKYTYEVHQKEKYWYPVEVLIGPVVVVAVFFLLKQSVNAIIAGITGPELKGVDGSIYATMGVSFVLGYFIRRTLGIFDLIKDKLPLLKDIETDKLEQAMRLKIEKEMREEDEKEMRGEVENKLRGTIEEVLIEKVEEDVKEKIEQDPKEKISEEGETEENPEGS